MFGLVCEGGLRTVDSADGEIFLVEVDLNGELACMLLGVLRFLKILEWPWRVLATLRPTSILPAAAALTFLLSMFKLLAVITQYIYLPTLTGRAPGRESKDNYQ